MKALNIIIALVLAAPALNAEEKMPVDLNASFQKLVAGTTKIVVRDGGDTCCVTPQKTLKQRVYFVIDDPGEISDLIGHVVFTPGAKQNDCLCCGHPGIDWYVGDRRVAITAVKHGYGLMKNSLISTFTPESRAWFENWLLNHKFKKDGQPQEVEQVVDGKPPEAPQPPR